MNLLNPVRSLLFPAFCGICDAIINEPRNGPACANCWAETRFFGNGVLICYKCGRYHSDKPADSRVYCRECDDDFYDLARACGAYDKALAETVISLKNRPLVPQRVFAHLFDSFASEPFKPADVVVPIPLSRRRRFERGYNQAELIADGFSKLAHIPIDRRSLARLKHTTVSRAAMDKKGRRMTVRNAFAVSRTKLIKDLNVLVIDDVMTSGATASMTAKALKQAGAARVEVLTIARAG